jgi:hypothetical protein
MENMLYYAHSGLRWLVVLVTIAAFLYILFRAFQNKPFDKRTHTVVVVWASLFGVQWLLGIILFLVQGAWDVGYQWEHAITMTLGLAVAHAYIPLKRRADNIRYYGVLGAIAGAMLLVFIGVARLPQGWTLEVDIDDDDTEAVDEALHPAGLTVQLFDD